MATAMQCKDLKGIEQGPRARRRGKIRPHRRNIPQSPASPWPKYRSQTHPKSLKDQAKSPCGEAAADLALGLP